MVLEKVVVTNRKKKTVADQYAESKKVSSRFKYKINSNVVFIRKLLRFKISVKVRKESGFIITIQAVFCSGVWG